MNFSVVTHKNRKETGRSAGMPFDKALKLATQINRRSQDRKEEHAYVEETRSVKHLPVTVK